MQSKEIADYKFSSLYLYLQNKYQENTLLQRELEQATSISEIWVLLFKHKLFHLCNTFMQAGIFYILKEEIQLPHPTYGYIWSWLSETAEGRALFKTLVHQGIKPIAEHLRSTLRNPHSAWYYIIQHDLDLLENFLLTKDIYPSSKDLSETIIESGLTLWSILAKNSLRCFDILLKKNILPSSQALSQSNDREQRYHGWFWLLRQIPTIPSSQASFLYLIQQGLLPKKEDLLAKDSQSTGWSFLIWSIQVCPKIMLLILQHLLPSEKILSLPMKIGAEKDTACNKNHWYYLAYYKDGLDIFNILLEKQIFPKATDLVNESQNVWRELAKSTLGASCMQHLVSCSILPQSTDLSSQDETDPWSIWALLLAQEKVDTFLQLLNKGILPSSKALAISEPLSKTTFHLSHTIKRGWDFLLYQPYQEILARLSHHHIIPTIREINSYRGFWWWNSHPMTQLSQIKELYVNYNIQGTHAIVSLLSNTELPSYYKALYFLYRLIDDCRYAYLMIIWPSGLSQMLSPLLSTLTMEDFLLPENRATFTKYYIMNELKNYLEKTACIHRKRAFSLNQALYKNENPVSILTHQFLMLTKTICSYSAEEQQQEKYKTPFRRRRMKGEFYRILKDGFFMCTKRTIKTKKIKPIEEVAIQPELH